MSVHREEKSLQVKILNKSHLEVLVQREKTRGEAPLGFLRHTISKLRFFPKTHNFFAYFEKSIKNTVAGVELLCKMIRNKDQRPSLVTQLKEYEHIGDKITHDVIDLLHETFLTPFDRTDIHTLVVKLDDIMDLAYYIGNRLTRYNVTKMPNELDKLATILLRSTKELSGALTNLQNIKNVQQVLKHCIEINRLENEADEKVNSVIGDLFNNSWDVMEVIKLKELIENLEAAADKCEDVANIIESIILKHS